MLKLTSLLIPSLALLACGPNFVNEDGSPSRNSDAVNSAGTTSGGSTTGATGGSTSTPGSGSGGSTGGLFPTIPNNGGGVLANPQVVLITFDGDSHQSTWEGDATWVATGGYLATVGAEYGVGNGSIALIRSSQTPPLPSGVESFLQAGMADGALPAYAANNIYVVMIPQSAAGTPAFCANDLGFHSYFFDDSGHQPLYAVIPDCSNDLTQVEITLAHEVVEASTDPVLQTYQIQNPDHPWALLDGEVADLCASNTTYVQDVTGAFSAPLIWSNTAALAGTTPCGPWPSTSPAYLTLIPSPATTQTAAVGTTSSFTLTGWASTATASSCNLIIASEAIGDFAVTPTASAQTVAPGGTISVALTVPSSALPGQRGASWIGCVDSVSGQVVGSTVIAVEAGAGPDAN